MNVPCEQCGEAIEATVPLWLNLDTEEGWSVYGIGDESAKVRCTEGHEVTGELAQVYHDSLTAFIEMAYPGTSWRDTDPQPTQRRDLLTFPLPSSEEGTG